MDLRFPILAAMCFILLAGCGQKQGAIVLDQPFTLKLNQSAASDDLAVRFVDVPADSRCPSDVLCIWAGQVTVLLNVSTGGQSTMLNLTKGAGNDNGSTGSVAGYSIRLVSVVPYPVSKESKESRDYAATLIVSK